MLNKDSILQQAHSYFSATYYDKAIFLYSQLISLEPHNVEYQIYCVFCDIGYEDSAKAQSLFDYFSIAKDEDFEQAVKYVKDIILAYDGNHEKMMQIFKDIADTSVESINAIDYADFMELVKSRGSFKEAYQDIMFSTKVAIKSKDDMIDFINNLIENNFETTAYNYLDNFNKFFSYDKDFNKLYERLGEKTLGNKS